MAASAFFIKDGLIFLKPQGSAPSDLVKGCIYIDTTSGLPIFYDGSSGRTAVTTTSTQTLTNKTLTSPAISGGTIASAAISGGTITGATFSSPSGLTKSDVGLSNVDNYSAAQLAALSQTLTNKTINSASNTITIDGDEATLSDINITSLKTNLSAASTFISRDASGIVVSTKAVPAGTVVGTSDSQTLTNKTLTAPVIATISNTGTLTLPSSTDTLVGRATTDTLTNKTLTSPVMTAPAISDNATFTEGSAASTPASGKVVIYAKADGYMYSKDDAGTETVMNVGTGTIATENLEDGAVTPIKLSESSLLPIQNMSVREWDARSAAAANSWNSVCTSGNLFVAVSSSGSGNRVMTSINGLVWTSRSSAADNSWNAVCYAEELNLFVAVASSGTGNRVMTSTNGTSWTSRTSAADNSWQDVCYSPELNLFVAVASTGTNRVMTSTNGTTGWATASCPQEDWYSVIWVPELALFVAVGDDDSALGGGKCMTSPDGTTWTDRAMPSGDWRSVCYSPELNLLIAVGNSSLGLPVVVKSSDAITWTAVSLGTAEDIDWFSVAYSPEMMLFVAVGDDGAAAGYSVMSSPDGDNWTLRKRSEDNNWNGICYSQDLAIFVAVSSDGTNRVMTSK